MKRATSLGTYLVGTTVHILEISATENESGEFRIDIPGLKKERGKLPDSWAAWERETKIRVRAALKFLDIDVGFSISFDHPPPFPPHVDLAIFAACAGAMGKLPGDWFDDRNRQGSKIFVGSFDFQGHVRPVRGVLTALRDYARYAPFGDERTFVVPYDNAIESSFVDTGTNVHAVKHVSELFDLREHTVARREYREPKPVDHIGPDLQKLPIRVVRAIGLSAVDGKPIHLIGENAHRGVRLLRSLLPPMSKEDAIESASLLSVAGLFQPDAFGIPSYRAPHHTVNERGLVGGDFPPRPGEVSLAHGGLLCLFDLPQFGRGKIEVLAPVLREGKASLWRRDIRTEFPARTQLVTTATRCPCIGEKPSGRHSEYCAERADRKSDPSRDKFYLGWKTQFCNELGIDRIVDSDFLSGDRLCEESIEVIRARVAKGKGAQ